MSFNAVSGVTEHLLGAPGPEPAQHKIAHRFAHASIPFPGPQQRSQSLLLECLLLLLHCAAKFKLANS